MRLHHLAAPPQIACDDGDEPPQFVDPRGEIPPRPECSNEIKSRVAKRARHPPLPGSPPQLLPTPSADRANMECTEGLSPSAMPPPPASPFPPKVLQSCVNTRRSRGQRPPDGDVGNKYLPFFLRLPRFPFFPFVAPLEKTSGKRENTFPGESARNAEYFPAFAPSRAVSQVEEGRKLLARSGVDWMLITLSLHPRSAGLEPSPPGRPVDSSAIPPIPLPQHWLQRLLSRLCVSRARDHNYYNSTS